MNVMPPWACPSLPCGVYSTVILLNAKLTYSTRSVLLGLRVAGLDGQIGDAALLDGDLEELELRLAGLAHASARPCVISSLLRSADISAVDALSTRLTIFSSRTIALPVAVVPPPSAGLRLHAPGPAHDLDLVGVA